LRYFEYYDAVVLNDFNPGENNSLILSKIIPLGKEDDELIYIKIFSHKNT